MKCLILAGGRGERLWPMSRKNYPKQFIQIQKNHSLFQETVARNLPYCDEFIVSTSYEYRFIVESQMKVFQGVSYRCVYEETPRKTAAAITLACMDLPLSEQVFVAYSDQLIDTENLTVPTGLSYQGAILEAKRLVNMGKVVLFGLPGQERNPAYGWICAQDDAVTRFIADPAGMEVEGEILHNGGMMLFENGVLQRQLRRYAPEFYAKCKKAHRARAVDGFNILYKQTVMNDIPAYYLEALLFQQMQDLRVVHCGFCWSDVRKLEDLAATVCTSDGPSVMHNCKGSTVINQSPNRVVVLNNADDLMVVNTEDAVYVGKQGKSSELKHIFAANPQLDSYSEHSTMYYRSWGFYQQLFQEARYRIRRVVLYPGKTIFAHRHTLRSESWTVVQGSVAITLNGEVRYYGTSDHIDIPTGVIHQITNVGDAPAVFVETTCGEIYQGEKDMIAKPGDNVGVQSLGLAPEPLVKLTPALKTYLWGGTKLQELYGKQCPYSTIAESWELSAHPAGQCTVATGRYKGMPFGSYLRTVGKEVLGWKCQPMSEFPLLVKFIDARENLSVQVHPDDDYALENESEYGKNEMWYIVDCEPGSQLYIGFNRDVTRDEVIERVQNNTILEVLNQVPTHPGDVFFVPAGTVHAIGAGNFICEIQQSSNSTYRLYDYDRRDVSGNPRQLHMEKALEVLDLEQYALPAPRSEIHGEEDLLSQCKYFKVKIYDIDTCAELELDESSFLSVLCLSGCGTLSVQKTTQTVSAGDCVFIQAIEGRLRAEGTMKIIALSV
ncbi:MAG: cupin domain-containing protein [Oscillospiraceae bacterium]|nr:cupin domain-containing protein [Oscillospiraceae bacterium]